MQSGGSAELKGLIFPSPDCFSFFQAGTGTRRMQKYSEASSGYVRHQI
jgi:hypothetical protein